MNAVSKGRSLLAKAQLLELSPQDVHIPARIGFLHEDKAAALGRLMAVDGQRDPIKVVAQKGEQPWRLVTGMHRLMGANYEGIPVFAIEVTGKAEDLADLEASENLHRRPLGPIERAKFTAALVHAAQERLSREHGGLSQHKLAIKARWDRVKAGETRAEEALTEETSDTCLTMRHVYGWEESVRDALDLGRATIHRDLALYRFLIEPFPELIEALSRHPVVGENKTELGNIAKIKSESSRRKTIEALLDNPEIGVDDARIAAGVDLPSGPDATPVAYQKHYNAIEGGWSRLGRAEANRFLPRFAKLLTPEQKSILRDALDEEASDAS